MLTIAFHTPDYAHEAELFRASLEQVGMEHEITAIESRGDWYDNTAYKPVFLREMRQKHTGPLLYIDVDAFVHENCEGFFEGLAERGVDFGAHWFRGPAKGHDLSKVRDEGWWMLSGTLFLGDTTGCRQLLDTWVMFNRFMRQIGVTQGGGQKNLWYLVTCLEHLKVERLPGCYCRVFDKPWAYDTDEPVIIEHSIASREHRPPTNHVGPFHGRVNQTRRNYITGLRKLVA